MADAYIHRLDPWLFRWGAFGLSWYWFVYLFSFFVMAWWLHRRLVRPGTVSHNHWLDLMLWGWVGLLLGGRLGYAIFYQPVHFALHPLEILSLWRGGMSWHGGIIGAGVAVYLLQRRHPAGFFSITDQAALVTPVFLLLGRLTNFVNGELWGRPTQVPWAVVFPRVDHLARHPSQIYEALGEGLLLLLVLLWVARRHPRPGVITVAFLGGYSLIRLALENFREPDPQVGFVFQVLTLGQVYCAAGLLAAGLMWMRLPTPKETQTTDRETPARGAPDR